MKTIKIDLPRSLEYIEIDTMADLHNGDKLCDFTQVRARIKEAKENPNRYLILNGDLMNNAIRSGVSDIYDEELSPMESLKRCDAMFGEVADKILSITTGNHEFRTYKTDGIDISYLMAKQLGLHDRYAIEGIFLFLRLGELSIKHKESNGSGKKRQACYTIYHTHGTGGGKRAGGKANRVEDMQSIIDADIYIHSHTHLPLAFKKNYFRADARNNAIAEVSKLFVNTAATLKYGGYGQAMGFTPSNTENPLIILRGNIKEMKAIV